MLRNTAKKKPAKKIGAATIEFSMDDDDMLEMGDSELYNDAEDELEENEEADNDEMMYDDDIEDLSMYYDSDDALYADGELNLDESALYEDDAAELSSAEYYADDEDGEYEDEYADDEAEYETYTAEDDDAEYAEYDDEEEAYDEGAYEEDEVEYADDEELYDDEYTKFADEEDDDDDGLIDLEMTAAMPKQPARKPARAKQAPAAKEIEFDDDDFEFDLEDLEPVPRTVSPKTQAANEIEFVDDDLDEIMELDTPVPLPVRKPRPFEEEIAELTDEDLEDDDYDFDFEDGNFDLSESFVEDDETGAEFDEDEQEIEDELPEEPDDFEPELDDDLPELPPLQREQVAAKAPSIGRPSVTVSKEPTVGKPRMPLAEARPKTKPPAENASKFVQETAEPVIELVHEPEPPKDKMSEILRQAKINQQRIAEVLSNTVTLAPQSTTPQEPPPNVANRRQHARIQASILVDYVSSDDDGDSSQGMGVVLDISISGLKLQTPRALAGNHIVVFATDFNDNVMEIKGSVRQSYQKENIWMNGISFDSPENDTIKFITNLVRIFNSRKYMKSGE